MGRSGYFAPFDLWDRFAVRAAAGLVLVFASGCGNTGPSASGRSGPLRTEPVTPIRFRNVAAEAGLHFPLPQQPRPMRNLEAFGRGCAFLDYDNDGWQDVLLVGQPSTALFRNRNGRFEDMSKSTGMARHRGPWHGCAVGDYNGDGYPDVLLTGFRLLALLRNDYGRGWVDVTRRMGLDPTNRGHWGSSAGFMDLDGDSRLDLVLLNYVVFGPREKQYCELMPGLQSGCPPSAYRPEFGELWRNRGKRFEDVTGVAGLTETHGKGLTLAFADVDGDARIDFYIGNDGTPADLLRNRGGLRFANTGKKSGVAFSSIPGHAIAAMGADWADYDRDGRLDLAVTAFSDEPYSLLHNIGNGSFEHTEEATRISGPTFKPLGFGANWADVDNDGWPDLLFVNGHVYDNVDQIDPLSTLRQPVMLFHNRQGQQFVDLAPSLGGDLAAPILGRGSAAGDFNNDGRTDFLIVDLEGEPLLLRNDTDAGNHWITLDLRSGGANRFAYGAKIEAQADGQSWVGQVSPACSYLSSSDPRVHFGLASTSRLDTVTIRWPGGRREVLKDLAVDRIVKVTEGETARAKPSARRP